MLLKRLFNVLCMNYLFEAPHQIPSAWLVGVIVGAAARDLCADTPLHCVLDRGLFPSAYGKEFSPVYGLWPWWLWLAPVCSACGEKTPQDSRGSCGDFAPPGATGAILDPPTAGSQDFTATDPVIGAEA